MDGRLWYCEGDGGKGWRNPRAASFRSYKSMIRKLIRLSLPVLAVLIGTIGPVNAIVVAPTPGQQNGVSIDTTTTGSAVTVLAANSRRQNCVVQNQSGNTMFVTWDGTTASAINGWAIAAGAYFSCGGTIITVTGPISLFDSTAGDRYYVSETSAAPQ